LVRCRSSRVADLRLAMIGFALPQSGDPVDLLKQNDQREFVL
jgi:hypothetical protein